MNRTTTGTATGTATVTLTDATVNRPTAGRTNLRIPPVLGPLSVELGTGVVGVVGRNGAGKTTLLGLIAGQLRPTIGHVVHSVADGSDGAAAVASGTTSRDAFDDPHVLANTSLTGVDIDYVPSWTVASILQFAARRHPRWDMEEAVRLVHAFDLEPALRYGTLSRGQRTAVGIIIGLAAHTQVTLLDEPYVGLDAQSRRLFYRALMESVQDDPRLIVISTHHLPDLERIVDRVLVLEDGHLVHDIDAGDLEGRFVRITGSTSRVDAVVAALPSASVLTRQDMAGASRAVVDLGGNGAADGALNGALDAALSDIHVEAVDLEEAVVQLTGGEQL